MRPKGYKRGEIPEHGTHRRYNHYGCRCERCCVALRTYKRNYYRTHRMDYRADALRRTYGLTQDDFENMFIDQEGVCALCKQAMKDRHFDIDHSHTTRHIRGLLCRRCNNNLGWYEKVVRHTIEPYLMKEHKYGKTPR